MESYWDFFIPKLGCDIIFDIEDLIRFIGLENSSHEHEVLKEAQRIIEKLVGFTKENEDGV